MLFARFFRGELISWTVSLLINIGGYSIDSSIGRSSLLLSSTAKVGASLESPLLPDSDSPTSF